jgi:ATP-binding cassette subfamily F protein 3
MLYLQSCSFSVGPRVLFENLDWVIGPGDRHALVGPNGAGKTTLLRLAVGELTPERGERTLARGTRIGYLPQEAAERFQGTVLGRALEARRDVRTLREELDDLHRRLATSSPDDEALPRWLERAGDLQERLELLDEHAVEPEARRILSGLGFSNTDPDRPLSEFSGGWRMRAALASLLLADPTVLLLDEPTNHLDLPALEWLEDYLERFRGGLVVVSHDRVFLDRVAAEVRELETGRWTPYSMGFTSYLEERERRRDQAEAHNQQIERKIAQLDRFVQRFGAKNTKASQAQSKRKQITRLEAQRVVLPRHSKSVRFRFPDPPHGGRVLLSLAHASFGYDARDVFADASLAIEREEKVAIVGANGAGKTTLLRVLAGQLGPRIGSRELSPLARPAYFAQHAAETLEPDLTVLEALERAAPPDWRPRLRSHLGHFLFSGDDVFKRCRVLSGGERQRVALALILLEPANLLMLDEPTHHLDLTSKEVLEEALAQYPGAVLVVTHDRSLMARLATRVIEIRDGRVIPYPGGYDDYEAARVAREMGGVPAPTSEPSAARSKTARAPRAPAREPRADRPATQASRRARDLRRIEEEIQEREAQLREIETRLADPGFYRDGSKARELLAQYERTRTEVESLWQRLAEL